MNPSFNLYDITLEIEIHSSFWMHLLEWEVLEYSDFQLQAVCWKIQILNASESIFTYYFENFTNFFHWKL